MVVLWLQSGAPQPTINQPTPPPSCKNPPPPPPPPTHTHTFTPPPHFPMLQVDPLRSLAKNRPEFGAYRVYPPEYTAPANQVYAHIYIIYVYVYIRPVLCLGLLNCGLLTFRIVLCLLQNAHPPIMHARSLCVNLVRSHASTTNRSTDPPTNQPTTHPSLLLLPLFLTDQSRVPLLPFPLPIAIRCRTGRRCTTTRRAWSAGAAAGTGGCG